MAVRQALRHDVLVELTHQARGPIWPRSRARDVSPIQLMGLAGLVVLGLAIGAAGLHIKEPPVPQGAPAAPMIVVAR